MLFFSLLSLGKGRFNPAAGHDQSWPEYSPLLFCRPALLRSSQSGGFPRVGMTVHSLFIPAMEELHVDIELIENPGRGLVDHIVQCSRTVVKSRHRRKDHRAH